MNRIIALITSFFTSIQIAFKVLVVFILILFGDSKYTGGQANSRIPDAPQWWWVETYDECLDAISQLESKGSSFDTSTIFSYEGDNFDVKYCFSLEYRNYLRYGRDNPFKRKNENVKIYAFIFLKNVSIDDFVYTRVNQHCAYYFRLSPEYIDKYQDVNAEDLEMKFNSFVLNPDQGNMVLEKTLDYTTKDTGELVFQMFGAYEENMIPLSDADIDAILDSVVVIGGDK